jgi:hypothetical protein
MHGGLAEKFLSPGVQVLLTPARRISVGAAVEKRVDGSSGIGTIQKVLGLLPGCRALAVKGHP